MPWTCDLGDWIHSILQGVPEEAVEDRSTESPRAAERWTAFHDAGESDMTFGDYGTQLNAAPAAHSVDTSHDQPSDGKQIHRG